MRDQKDPYKQFRDSSKRPQSISSPLAMQAANESDSNSPTADSSSVGTTASCCTPGYTITYCAGACSKPSGIATNTSIDYSTVGGSKIFKSATDALTTKFDLDIENLPVFIEALETQALQQG
jgi:hypothetical protein